MEVFLQKKDGGVYKKNYEYTPAMFFVELEKDVKLVKVEVKKNKEGMAIRDGEGIVQQKVTVLKGKELTGIYDHYEDLLEKSKKPVVVGVNVSRETSGVEQVEKRLQEFEKAFEEKLAILEREIEMKLAELQNRFESKIEEAVKKLSPK